MSDEQPDDQPLTRRQLMQRGAVAAASAAFLAACGGEVATPEPTPTQAIAQVPPTQTTLPPTALPPTATAAPASETAVPPTEEPTAAPTETVALEPTPQCDDGDDETPAQTEGPFYTPQTPERASFLEDGPGQRIVVTGRVLTTGCVPIAGAIVDFWHADDAGEYDNVGYNFRGHQFTDANGAYRLETVVPGLYPGRTRHFHVKVQGPATTLLTTQLYFPNEPGNAQDGIFHPALVMATQESAEGSAATFDFVLG